MNTKSFLSKLITACLALSVSAAMLTGCGGTDENAATSAPESEASVEKTLKIGYVDTGKSFPNEVLAIAIDHGFLDDELSAVGYKAEPIPFTGAGPAINEALVGGSIDAATVGDVPAIIAKSNGVNTTLVGAEVHFNDAALAVPASSDIQSIADLKGKTVATLQGSYMHKVLIDMLESEGMTIDDIQFTNMTSQDAAAALEAGTIDAAVVANTQESVLAASENVRLVTTCENNPEWKGGHSIVVLSDYLSENRDAVVALDKALIRAAEYAKENKEEAVASLEKCGISKESIEFLFKDEVDFNFRGDDEVITAYEDIQKFLIDNELARNEVNFGEWLDKSVYEDAEKAVKGE